MIREYQQNRHSDSLLLLDLPDSGNWTSEECEMAISLAATICAEQTRASSGSRYLLGLASRQTSIISSRSPAGFREEALDALAVCERSGRASLEDLIAAVVAGHGLSDERMILITPRPKDARLALQQASKLLFRNSVDLLAQTTIVEATTDSIGQILHIEGVVQAPTEQTKPQPTSAVTGGVA